jgi:hypothetical protein
MLNEALSLHGKSFFKPKNAKQVEAFLRSSPKYQALQNHISELPEWLSKDLGRFHPSARGAYRNARFFKQQILLPSVKPVQYCNRFSKLLDNKIVRLGSYGGAWMWGLGAAITLVDVTAAPPGKKVQTASRDTAGMLLGAAGGAVGWEGGVVIGFILGLTGTGEILLIAACSAAIGYGVSEGSKKLVDVIFQKMGW